MAPKWPDNEGYMSGLWIIGAGGHAKVAIAAAEAAGEFIAGVVDSNPALAGQRLLGHSILGAHDWSAHERVHLAIGDNKTRARLATEMPVEWISIEHPAAWSHASAQRGEGVLVCAAAVIQPDARIGRHVILNTGSIVEHDCILGDFSFLGPRACLTGGVTLGTGCFVGAGATVCPGVRLGNHAIVGAGAVVTKDVPDGVTVVGVPAQKTR